MCTTEAIDENEENAREVEIESNLRTVNQKLQVFHALENKCRLFELRVQSYIWAG